MARTTTTATTLHFKRPRVHLTLDGEVEQVGTPLRFAVRPQALHVLVPPPELDDDAARTAPVTGPAGGW